MSLKTDKAVALYRSGFNCAQAVLLAFAVSYGMDETVALRAAGGLGGGCRSGEICGAASGAVIVIGLKYGQTNPGDKESKALCGANVRAFVDAFRQANGALTCRDLLGCETSTPEGMAMAVQQNLFDKTCVPLIVSAVGLLEEQGY